MKRRQKFHEPPRGYERELRVAQVLRNDLAEIIRYKLRDQRLETTHVCVDEVRVNKDCSHADVYVSSLIATSPDAKENLVDVLTHAKGFLRTELARRNNFRTTPELFFHFDETRENGRRMDSLIKSALRRETHGT